MKLIDLKPRWFAEAGRQGQGVSFECPHCVGSGQRLAVAFKNPLDGGAPIPLEGGHKGPLWGAIGPNTVPPGFLWDRHGEAFEVLSLTPSVDCSRSGHWHGHVRNGEANGC